MPRGGGREGRGKDGRRVCQYYFRVKENGAAVFKVDTENRQRRIEMDQIAVVNINNGQIKPQGDRTLGDDDLAVIRDWMAQRAATLARALLPVRGAGAGAPLYARAFAEALRG